MLDRERSSNYGKHVKWEIGDGLEDEAKLGISMEGRIWARLGICMEMRIWRTID